MTLEEKLALSQKTQQIVEQGIPQQMAQKRQNAAMNGSVEYLDKAVYGDVDTSIGGYDAKEEMKKIKERQNSNIDISNSKLPKSILESIKENPLNIESVDPQMDSFTERLAAQMPGIKRSLDIQNKLGMVESKEPKETTAPTNNTAKNSGNGIDYELLKMIVENVVEKSLAKFQSNMLNESVSINGNSSPIKALKLTESNKFLFLDSDDNVYECQMKYKGKNKKRTK